MSERKEPNRASWLEGPQVKCSPIAAEQSEPWRLVLLGPPGVGKGTQAQLLHQNLGACHLSTGDAFRTAAHRPLCEQSPSMAAASGCMKRGELVPDGTVWEMVRERSGCLRCRGGFLLDGFPRTLPQAESLQELLERENLRLHAVVNYELPLAEIVERLSGRRTCPACKSVFHTTQQPPRVAGVCDQCGMPLLQREDDRPESVRVRMRAYIENTAPLIEFYRNCGNLLPVAATGTPEEICSRTISDLRNAQRTAERRLA
jgi:adenylate kinase